MSVHEQFAEDLALYALGALGADERQELAKHLEVCASCRRELDLLHGDLSLMALATAGPKPPVRARQRLMSAIAREPKLPIGVPSSSREPTSRRSVFGWTIGRWMAAIALVTVCAGLIRQNSVFQASLSSLSARYSEQGNTLEEVNQTVATLLDPDSTKIELVAAGNKPQPRGKAIYQRRTRNLIFLASNLPALPPEKIYELWLFPANGGAPIAAGLFKPDARGSATVINPPLPEGIAAKNFAVTLEPESGSHEAPRGTSVIVGAGE